MIASQDVLKGLYQVIYEKVDSSVICFWDNLGYACKTWKMKAVVLAQASSGLTGVDLLKLKLKDFNEGLIEVLDKKTKCKKRICQLKLVRIKTYKEFTTFISEESVNAIERYLKLERNDPQPDDALFTASRADRDHLFTVSLQQAYKNLN